MLSVVFWTIFQANFSAIHHVWQYFTGYKHNHYHKHHTIIHHNRDLQHSSLRQFLHCSHFSTLNKRQLWILGSCHHYGTSSKKQVEFRWWFLSNSERRRWDFFLERCNDLVSRWILNFCLSEHPSEYLVCWYCSTNLDRSQGPFFSIKHT